MGEGDEDTKLRKAVRSSLVLASEGKFKSISIPAISSGIFGLTVYKAVGIHIVSRISRQDILRPTRNSV
jgi:O-acetyl-ADP-ribose deacetylase (regulator of RNase III)